jgi:tRNA1Val (adenine37-N6)-methyltransferase
MANDYFRFRQFTIHQARCAMKVGTDGTLLGAWAGLLLLERSRILDVGTGTGLIALMMAQRFPEAQVIGIDIDEEAVSQARENVAASPFADRIEILHEDFAEMEGTFDAIVSNPPYFADSLKSPDAQRTLARHANTLPYRLLMQQSWKLLSNEGELSVVVPADYKSRMEAEAALAGFFKSRECAVRTSPRKMPKRWLLAFRKHPTPLERDELTLGTERCNELTKDFYL